MALENFIPVNHINDFVLIISEETNRVNEIKLNIGDNVITTGVVVPKSYLKKEEVFSRELRGRLFTHVKLNARLTRSELGVLNRNLLPVMRSDENEKEK